MAQNPYRIADKATELLTRKAIKRFEAAKAKARQLKFDELEVLSITKELYKDLERDNEKTFLELAQERYQEAEPHGEEPPDRKWLLALLLAYNATLKWQYIHEVERKQAYTAEGINSSAAKVAEFRKGLSKWSQMTKWFAIEVSDAATLEAYEDAGVKYIVWNTMMDGRECGTCEDRNGKVYPIHAIPPKPHPGCRCWYTAADKK